MLKLGADRILLVGLLLGSPGDEGLQGEEAAHAASLALLGLGLDLFGLIDDSLEDRSVAEVGDDVWIELAAQESAQLRLRSPSRTGWLRFVRDVQVSHTLCK